MQYDAIVPLETTGFNVTAFHPSESDVTITLTWDPPSGSGPETVVDNYIISVTPMPVSHSVTSIVLSPPWIVTLDYNQTYTATIVAVNCAGESIPSILLVEIPGINNSILYIIWGWGLKCAEVIEGQNHTHNYTHTHLLQLTVEIHHHLQMVQLLLQQIQLRGQVPFFSVMMAMFHP